MQLGLSPHSRKVPGFNPLGARELFCLDFLPCLLDVSRAYLTSGLMADRI